MNGLKDEKQWSLVKDLGVKYCDTPGLPSNMKCNCVSEILKTCGNCVHDEKPATDIDSPCYLCQRNLYDNRIDKWEGKNV